MTSIFRTRGHLDPQRDAAIFVPRPEGEEIWRMVRQSMVSSYIALLGSRQTGKTSLLYQLKARLRQTPGYASALLDLSPLEGQTNEGECYRYICRQLLGEVANVMPLTDEERQRLANTREPIDFRGFLSEGAKRIQQARLVVLLDEIGALHPKVADRFFSILRSIFSSRDKESEREFQKYIFIFAGAVDLLQLTVDVVSPLNICERVYLNDFGLSGVQFLLNNLQKVGCPVKPKATARLYEWSGGHPYLTQRLCAILERQVCGEAEEQGSSDTPAADRQPPSPITPTQVDAAAAQILAGDDNLAHVMGQLERYPDVSGWLLRFIRRGQKVQFSRVNRTIARLELIGAIKNQGGFCAIRNGLYAEMLRSHMNEVSPVAPELDGAALRGQLDAHRRRLFQLEENRAELGLAASSSLLTKIAAEESAINELRQRLGEL